MNLFYVTSDEEQFNSSNISTSVLNKKSTDVQQVSNTQTENPFAGRGNKSELFWLDDALKDIAYYLRAHKFNEYDRRYQADATSASREYYVVFPQPPLRSLHWEVKKFCELSFISCVEYLIQRIKNTGLKRTDDTTIVIQMQQWNVTEHSKQIDAVEKECRKMLKVDDALANPFQGPLERFQWRTTASYYMCWFTTNQVPDLQHLHESCDNFANCLNSDYGIHNNDPRAEDNFSYSCALYSFCPDPCCSKKHLNKLDDCWKSNDNPCFVSNSDAQQECTLNRSQNTNFEDIVLNRWNVTCKCFRMGFEWDSKYGMCVDVDECLDGLHSCDPEREACVNLEGSFRCACRWGYVWNSTKGFCETSKALDIINLQNKNTTDSDKNRKATSIVKFIFKKIFNYNRVNRHVANFLIIIIAFAVTAILH